MISELTIEKFRGIDNLKLDALGKVNIIAGENNTGKTSILEVIESLQGPNNLRAWRLLGKREGNSGPRMYTTVYDTMKSLFPINNEMNKTYISYSGKNDGKVFSVQLLGQFSETILSDEQLNANGGYVLHENKNEYEHNEYEASVLDIQYIINGENCGKDKIYSIQRGIQYSDNIVRIINNVVYVSPKYSLQGTTQGNGLTGGVPPVRFSM